MSRLGKDRKAHSRYRRYALTFFSSRRKEGTVLFFEKKSRQKKLQLLGSLYRILSLCTDRACIKGKRNFSNRGVYAEFYRLLCVKGAFLISVFQSSCAAGAPLLFDLLSYLFSKKSLSRKNRERLFCFYPVFISASSGVFIFLIFAPSARSLETISS